jgi:hypothetical protein
VSKDLGNNYVSQKQHGEFAVDVERRFGLIEGTLNEVLSSNKTNRNLAIGVLTFVIIDIVVTLLKWKYGA